MRNVVVMTLVRPEQHDSIGNKCIQLNNKTRCTSQILSGYSSPLRQQPFLLHRSAKPLNIILHLDHQVPICNLPIPHRDLPRGVLRIGL